MCEVKSTLNEVIPIRKIAIVALRDLLAKHELDDRYQNKVRIKKKTSITNENEKIIVFQTIGTIE